MPMRRVLTGNPVERADHHVSFFLSNVQCADGICCFGESRNGTLPASVPFVVTRQTRLFLRTAGHTRGVWQQHIRGSL